MNEYLLSSFYIQYQFNKISLNNGGSIIFKTNYINYNIFQTPERPCLYRINDVV